MKPAKFEHIGVSSDFSEFALEQNAAELLSSLGEDERGVLVVRVPPQIIFDAMRMQKEYPKIGNIHVLVETEFSYDEDEWSVEYQPFTMSVGIWSPGACG